MGTSVNQRSPETNNWRIVQRAYENADVPISLALRDIWRAADNQPEGNLFSQLADPAIGALAAVAGTAASPTEASSEVGRLILDQNAASLAADITRRAVMQSAGRENALALVVERVFMEATNYLVSRDIPGHIRPGARLETVAEARAFKQEAMTTTAEAVRRTTPPPSFQGDDWSSFVSTVVRAIQRR
jgi:hypothetical protein